MTTNIDRAAGIGRAWEREVHRVLDQMLDYLDNAPTYAEKNTNTVEDA